MLVWGHLNRILSWFLNSSSLFSRKKPMPTKISNSTTLVFQTLLSMGLLTITANLGLASPITFAQLTETNGAQDWSVAESVSGGVTTTTVTETGTVNFSFQGTGLEPFGGAPQTANFSLSATTTSLGNCATNCGPGDGFNQNGYSGSFSITDANSGSLFGSNFLSGTFAVTGSPTTTGAQFSANLGSGSGSFNASATAGNLNQLVFTSAYLNFPNTITQETASFSLSSLIPNFAITTPTANQAYPSGSYTAAGTGTFSSNPAPTVVPAPEPATFGLIGGSLLCVGLLRRKKMQLLSVR
jgi:hypothetical protein